MGWKGHAAPGLTPEQLMDEADRLERQTRALRPDGRTRKARERRREALAARRRRGYARGRTQEDYDKLVERQRGGCAVCQQIPTFPTTLSLYFAPGSVDVPIAAICKACRSGVGFLQHDLERVTRLQRILTMADLMRQD